MSPKRDSKWFANHEEEVMVAGCRWILDTHGKISLMKTLCCEKIQESSDGLTAKQLLDAIHAFLNTDPDIMTAYVYLHMLAYYPQSMTSYNLTPKLQALIAYSYYTGQVNKKMPRLSMEELAKMLNRSKSTIHEALVKRVDVETSLRADVDVDRDRAKARQEAYRELVEEEKQFLKVQRENDQKNQGNVRTNGAGS